MAHELNILLDPTTQSGLTVVARLYAAGTLAATVSLTESPASSACYSNAAAITGLAAGTYVVALDSGSTLVGTGVLVWDGAAEVSVSTLSGSTATLLGRLTAGRAGNLDNLDTPVSSVVTAVGAVLSAVGTLGTTVSNAIAGVAAAVWAYGTRTLTGKVAATVATGDGVDAAAALTVVNELAAVAPVNRPSVDGQGRVTTANPAAIRQTVVHSTNVSQS